LNAPTHGGYVHAAMFYGCADEFMDGTLEFIRAGTATRDPTLVVLSREKIDALQSALGDRVDAVLFADMAEVGANPARIIPAWQDFLDEHRASALRLRGIGEPISAERGHAELAECERHEALLNLVFSDTQFTLLCPYDTSALSEAVIAEARRNHPYVADAEAMAKCHDYAGEDELRKPFAAPLPQVPADAARMEFEYGDLREIRSFVAEHATGAGLSRERCAELVLAADELASNSMIHATGSGSVSVWREQASLMCEVRDAGQLCDPLAGRRRPRQDSASGRGLWIANQVCDLVALRSFADGLVVRLHMYL
jgi:anti-sigma regulatory factor (Ser/Thr protein kinase)